jgi:hypothetical protein
VADASCQIERTRLRAAARLLSGVKCLSAKLGRDRDGASGGNGRENAASLSALFWRHREVPGTPGRQTLPRQGEWAGQAEHRLLDPLSGREVLQEVVFD